MAASMGEVYLPMARSPWAVLEIRPLRAVARDPVCWMIRGRITARHKKRKMTNAERSANHRISGWPEMVRTNEIRHRPVAQSDKAKAF